MENKLSRIMILSLFYPVILAVFLTACGSVNNDSYAGTAEAGNSSEQSSSSRTDDVESGSAYKSSEENDFSADTEILYGSFEDEGGALVNVFEEEGLKVEYIHALSYGTGQIFDGFRFSNTSQDTIQVELESLCLNSDIMTDAGEKWHISGESVEVYNCPEISNAWRLAQNDGISVRELFCVFQIEGGEKKEKTGNGTTGYSQETASDFEKDAVSEKTCIIPILTERSAAWLCEPVRGMQAEKQVLYENDTVRINLLGCGNYFSAGDYSDSDDRIEGILLYENKSEEEIPCCLTGIQVNGVSITSFSQGDLENTIPAGMKRMVRFSIDSEEMTNQGIDGVAELNLQFLTDRRQTGWSGANAVLEGGEWYSVTLSKAVESRKEFDEGSIVYEDEWIRMGYLLSYYDGYKLSILNKSSENLELLAIESEATVAAGYSLYFGDESIGAGSQVYRKLELMADQEPEPLSKVEFHVRVLKQGGYKLLHESEEWVSLPPDPAAENAVRPASGKFISGKDIPVLVNGTAVSFGEMTLQDFLDQTGMLVREEDKGKIVEIEETEIIDLDTGNEHKIFHVLVENYGVSEAREAEDCKVYGIDYDGFYSSGGEEESDSLLSVGGIHVGDRKEDVAAIFGMTEDESFSYYFNNVYADFSINEEGIVESIDYQVSSYYY